MQFVFLTRRPTRRFALAGLLILAVAGFSGSASAQTFEDAIRFSQRQPLTGVRSLGMGGAGIAGMADYSAMVTNPAGLGHYRNSSFSTSLSFWGTEDRGVYSVDGNLYPLENTSSDVRIGHLSYVHKAPTKRGSLVAGVGINQIQSFDRELVFRGDNGINSATDFFLPVPGEFEIESNSGSDGIFGTADDEFIPSFSRDLSFIAFQLFAIDLDVDAYEAGDEVPFFPAVTRGTVEQSGSIRESGSMHEVNFGAAFEAAPGVMLGGSINIPFGRWELERFYAEEDVLNDNDGTGGSVDFDYLEWTQNVDSRIAGINVRGGVSVRTGSGFSVGASFESPTYYQVSEEYSTVMHVEFDDGYTDTYGDDFSEDVGAGEYEYNVISPWRVGVGVGYTNGNLSLFADAELVDWTQLELDAEGFSYAAENRLIREQLDGVVNLRFGVEYDFGKISARGGIAGLPDQRMQAAGRASGDGVERDRGYVSAGITYEASRQFLIDFGWSGEAFDDAFVPYNVTDGPVVSEEVLRGRFAIGVRARL